MRDMNHDADRQDSRQQDADAPKYWAFVSYSHRDATWGNWVHRALETYRVPRRLVGRESRDGLVPRRLFPLFRDREELPTSANLNDNIHSALRDSRYLIVICSPHAAASRWVDEEVRLFKALGREDRVLCLIVDGEPNASDQPDGGMPECFPRAVRFQVGPDGQLTGERTEPIAADARPGRDGVQNAKLKLLAGLLGVGFDELKQRERQRAVRRRMQWSAFALALVLLVVGTWQWQQHKRLEQARLEQIAQLTESGRQELLAGSTLRSAVYLSEAYRLGGNDEPLRLMLAWVMRSIDAEVATLASHSAAVNFATYSPDGHRILTGADDGTAKIWNADTHELVATLKGHKWFVRAGGFTPDGRTAFTVGTEEEVKLWNSESGELLATLDGEQAQVSRDGKQIVTTKDGKALLWDVATKTLVRELEGQTLHLAGAAFSPDGLRVAGGGGLDTDPPPSSNPCGRIWDTATGKIVAYLEGHTGAINCVVYSQDGNLIVTTSSDRTARLWDANDGNLLSSSEQHVDSVAATEVSPDSTRLLTYSAQVAVVWPLTEKRNPVVLVHNQWLNSAHFSPDGRRIVTGANDDSAYIWDAATGQQLLTLRGHAGRVESAEFSPDGHHVVTSSFDHQAKIWATGNPVVKLTIPVERASSISYSPDGTRLATAGARAEIWDKRDGKRLQSIDSHPQWGVRYVAFSPDGQRIVTASEDRTCKVSDVTTGQKLATFTGHDARVMSAEFSPDGSRIVSAALDHTAKIWDAATGTLIRSIRIETGQVSFATFHPDGERIVVVSGPSVTIWDVAKGELQLTLPEQSPASIHATFSRDGKHLATTGGDSAALWDVATGRLLVSFVGHTSQVNRIALHPAGTLAATASNDYTIRVWDTGTGKTLVVLQGHTAEVSDVQFSPDGQSLVSASPDDPARIWDIHLESRSAKTISEIVTRRVPLRLLEGRLVPKP
jgi:WD40 repeat protein